MSAKEEGPESSLVLYQSEDGRTRIQCRFEGETLRLTQALIAELFATTPQNVTMHLKAIYAKGELSEEATCKPYLQVRREGERDVTRTLLHHSLPAILAVGYRVRIPRGTQFRQWATARLTEFLTKGFTLDDERLKHPPGPGVPDYFDELLARFNERAVLPDAGRVSREVADAKAHAEFERFADRRREIAEARGEEESLKALEELAQRAGKQQKSKRKLKEGS